MLESKLLLAALVCSSLMGMVVSIMLAFRLRTLGKRLQTITAPLVQEPVARESSPPVGTEVAEFLPELLKAGLSAHLECGWKQRQTPEKYKYIGLLAEHGMGFGQISTVLNLPESEVSQVLILARIAGRSQQTAPHRSKTRKRTDKAKEICGNGRKVL